MSSCKSDSISLCSSAADSQILFIASSILLFASLNTFSSFKAFAVFSASHAADATTHGQDLSRPSSKFFHKCSNHK